MNSWFSHLKRGLTRSLPEDPLAIRGEFRGLRANLKNLQPFFTRHWKKGLLGSLLILLNTLFSFPQPLLNRYLIDHIILAKQLNRLIFVLLLMVGVNLLGKLTSALQQYFFTHFEQEILLDIQGNLFHRVLRFPKSFFDEREVGYLMSRLSADVNQLRWFFSATLVYILSNIIRLIGGIGLLFYLEWRLAMAALIIVPGVVAFVRYFSHKFWVISHSSMEQHAQVSRRMQESLSASSLIKAFSSEKRETDRYLSELRNSFQISLEQAAVGSVSNLIIGSLGDVTKLIVLAAGAYWVIADQWSLGSLLAFQSYVGLVYGPVQFLASSNLQFQNSLAALERVSALFDITPEEDNAIGEPATKLRGEIEFRNVSFSYGGEGPVLNDVSWEVHPGEHVAIVGPSGVGKTTLISLLMLFYTPTKGEIYFDGLPASRYQIRSLRQRIGYVSQRTLLLSGTIQENLRYGNPDAGQQEIIQAARIAGIDDFINTLPAGYNTRIGENGVNLSEGQKQRLSIARALIKSPDILVLDEPTSALDSLVEKTIFDRLPEVLRGKTTFIVAHRLATVQKADRILLLNENRLVATGTHQELQANNPYYRTLVANQQILSGPPTGNYD